MRFNFISNSHRSIKSRGANLSSCFALKKKIALRKEICTARNLIIFSC